MSGHIRPTPSVIRAWFLLFGVALILCIASMYDLTVEPADGGPDASGIAAFRIR
jgi:hypothetical protein